MHIWHFLLECLISFTHALFQNHNQTTLNQCMQNCDLKMYSFFSYLKGFSSDHALKDKKKKKAAGICEVNLMKVNIINTKFIHQKTFIRTQRHMCVSCAHLIIWTYSCMTNVKSVLFFFFPKWNIADPYSTVSGWLGTFLTDGESVKCVCVWGGAITNCSCFSDRTSCVKRERDTHKTEVREWTGKAN